MIEISGNDIAIQKTQRIMCKPSYSETLSEKTFTCEFDHLTMNEKKVVGASYKDIKDIMITTKGMNVECKESHGRLGCNVK